MGRSLLIAKRAESLTYFWRRFRDDSRSSGASTGGEYLEGIWVRSVSVSPSSGRVLVGVTSTSQAP